MFGLFSVIGLSIFNFHNIVKALDTLTAVISLPFSVRNDEFCDFILLITDAFQWIDPFELWIVLKFSPIAHGFTLQNDCVHCQWDVGAYFFFLSFFQFFFFPPEINFSLNCYCYFVAILSLVFDLTEWWNSLEGSNENRIKIMNHAASKYDWHEQHMRC